MQTIKTFPGWRCPCPAIWCGGFNNDANLAAPPIVVAEGALGGSLCVRKLGRKLGRRIPGAMEERRRGPSFLGECESESFWAVILYLFSCLGFYCQCLMRAHAESTCANKFENL